MAEARSLETEWAEEESQAAPFTFNDRRSRLDDDDPDNRHGNGHDTDELQGSSAQAPTATVHNSFPRSHPTHRVAASLHTPFQGASTGLPSPPNTAQRSLSSNGVYPTAARARPLSNGQLGTAAMTPARLTPLRRVNLVESRSSINRIGATSSPLSSDMHWKNGGFGGSNAGAHQSPLRTTTSRKWLVLVKGPPILPHSPPPNDASGFARAYGASGRYDGGVLMPLQQSLSAQVALIAREFSLPSIGGVALYLCLNNSTRSNNLAPIDRRRSRATSASFSTVPDDVSSRPASIMSTNEYHETDMFKPRILEETWGILWSAFLDPLGVAGEGVQGPFGPSLAIAGILEFDIDPRRAHWLANGYASSDPNEYHHSAQATHPSSSTSTSTLSAPPLRHAACGSELAHKALQRNRSGSQAIRIGSSASYVWHQPDQQEQRRTGAARSTDELPHALVRSTLGGHFGNRDDSNFDPQLDKSLEGSERGSYRGMMLRGMNDVGFEDEDQDSEEPESDVPSDVTSHDDSLTTDVEALHDLRTMEVGSGSAAFESFDHFLTSTPGPSSSAARQQRTQDSHAPGTPSRQGHAMSGFPEPLAERSFLDENDSTTLVEDDEALTPIGAEPNHDGVALLDPVQKRISPRHQPSMSDTEHVNSGTNSSGEYERKDFREPIGHANLERTQSASRGSSLDLKNLDHTPTESTALGDEPVAAKDQTPSASALEQVTPPTWSSKVLYPYFQLYPPHPPHFVSTIETPSTPSPTGSISKSVSSPNRRGNTPSPLQLKQHRNVSSSTSSDPKEDEMVSEDGYQEAHAREDPKVVTEAGQPWDETTPQDAIFAEYAQASPSGHDEASGFEALSGFPQEVDLNQVEQAKLKDGSSEESSLLPSPSPNSTSSSSGSSISTTFERALKTSGHRNILSLGESDTGSDIMPLSALFRPPPSGAFESSFDFHPSGPTAQASASFETAPDPSRRPPSPTLNATELNSTSSNVSAFVRAMGHPDDGIPFVLPSQGTEHSTENPLDVGDDSMDSEISIDHKPDRPGFDLQQRVPTENLLVGIEEDDDDDDAEEEDEDDEGIGLGEDQSCQIFDHLPSSPLPVEAKSSPERVPTAVQA